MSSAPSTIPTLTISTTTDLPFYTSAAQSGGGTAIDAINAGIDGGLNAGNLGQPVAQGIATGVQESASLLRQRSTGPQSTSARRQ